MEMILRAAKFEESDAQVQAPRKAFMDDITLLARDPTKMKQVLERLDVLINWSRMKFKAKKSRSFTFKRGKQVQMKFQIGKENIPTVKQKPVKSLGRLYQGNLTDRSQGVAIQADAEQGLKAIANTKLPGNYKVWCLQFGLYPRLAWPLMIYEVTLSRVEIIEQKCSKYIRRWLGLPRMINTTSLYRKTGALQLPLTSIVETYKAGKVRTVMMLRNSKDPEIKNNQPEVKTGRKWNAAEATDEATVVMQQKDIVSWTQTDRKGLPNGSFKPFKTMNLTEKRQAITDQVKRQESEKRNIHLIQCPQQGRITAWEENVVERKISWQEIWQWSASRLSFLLRSSYDVLPSPRNLVRWKIADDDKCRCGKVGTMKHILSNCGLALNRYKWRHDIVLKILIEVLQKQIDEINKGNLPSREGFEKIPFVKEGRRQFFIGKKKKIEDTRWSGKWTVSVDLPGRMVPYPIPTEQKPDIVLWCEEKNIIYFVELTVPHEDNIEDARIRKDTRYVPAIVKLYENAGWKAEHLPVEVGCRGFVGNRLRKWISSIGLSVKTSRQVISQIQEATEKASHWIWLKREDQDWFE